jgi:guanylate kinase
MKKLKPLMLAISAPSGAGKSTLCDKLVHDFSNIVYSISCTTRAPRGDEKDGEHYYFLSKKEFKSRIKKGEFLEYAKVHGNYYGTLEDTVLYTMEQGKHILLDIDVQGVEQIRNAIKGFDTNHPIRKGFIDIFILPPSLEELEKRLRGRGTDAEDVIQKRLKNAKKEIEQARLYGYEIVNDDLELAYTELKNIIKNA